MISCLLAVALLGQDSTQSGYLETLRYGSSSPQAHSQKIWFTNSASRVDTYLGKEWVMSHVVGPEGAWSAYPSAGYFQPLMKQKLWQAQVESTYEAAFKRRQAAGREVILGQQTSLYAWRDPGRRGGDVGGEPRDVKYWVRSDLALPIIMLSDEGNRTGERVTTLRFNERIGPAVFAKPKGLSVLQPFRCQAPFKVVFSDSFSKDGVLQWETLNTYESAGDRVKWTTVSGSGEPKIQELSLIEGRQQIYNRMMEPPWHQVRRVKGHEQILGLPAIKLEPVIPGSPSAYWVVEHPTMGTIKVRQESRTREGISRFEVRSL